MTDLRIYKTKNALVSAMLELLHKKKFEDITVQKICEVALVRRATFYLHFRDKLELFAYTLREVFSNFPSFTRLKEQNYTEEIFKEMATDAINFFSQNEFIIDSLLRSNAMPIMINIISEVLVTDIVKLSTTNNLFIEDSMTIIEMRARFYVSGVLNTYIWWRKEEKTIPYNDFIEHISQFVAI